MNYKVYCDDLPIHDLSDESLILVSPELTLKDNDAGSFTFTILPTHPYSNIIQPMISKIKILRDEVEIFCGRVTEVNKDFYNQRSVHCEGELNFLLDSIQRPDDVTSINNLSIREYLNKIISNHNAQVGDDKQFQVGVVTVEKPQGDETDRNPNYENTLSVIGDKLIDTLGGHIYVRKADGVRYVDYIADWKQQSTQTIEFGLNLFDFSQSLNGVDLCTAIIPLGAEVTKTTSNGTISGEFVDFDITTTTTERVNIKEVNEGVDYIYNEEAVNKYGWIFKTIDFPEITDAQKLKEKALEHLNKNQFEKLTLSVTAMDLKDLGYSFDAIELLTQIRVTSEPHDLNGKLFPITEIVIDLTAPENSTFTLGTEETSSLTTSSSAVTTTVQKQISDFPSDTFILNEARKNASQMIRSATHGNIVMTPSEMLVMDTDNIDTATKVWRWNLNGLGYSSTGYNGEFGTAITMNGTISGDKIEAGTISGDKIKTDALMSRNYVKDINGNITGSFLNLSDGSFESQNFKWAVDGSITSTKGQIGGFNIGKSYIKSPTLELYSSDLATGQGIIKMKANWSDVECEYLNNGIEFNRSSQNSENTSFAPSFSIFVNPDSSNEGQYESRIYMHHLDKRITLSSYSTGPTFVIQDDNIDGLGNVARIEIKPNKLTCSNQSFENYASRKTTIEGGIIKCFECNAPSDETLKDIIEFDDDKFDELFMKLKPIHFSWKGDKSGKLHTGLGARETTRLYQSMGLESSAISRINEETGEYSINYSELHALEISSIQKNRKMITDLIERVANLENLIKEGK